MNDSTQKGNASPKLKISNEDRIRINDLLWEASSRRFRKVKESSFVDGSSIGQNIKFYRKVRNISQEELAEKLNVDRGTINNWEQGRSCPDGWKMEDMAKIFEIGIEELHTKKIFKVGDDEAFQEAFAKEKAWLKKHPDCVLPFVEIKEGDLGLWEGNFNRDYVWIQRKDLAVVAFELLERGFSVVGLNLYGGLLADDGHWPLVVKLKRTDVEDFKKAISEIIAYFASDTSKYESVVNLRTQMERGDIDAIDVTEWFDDWLEENKT